MKIVTVIGARPQIIKASVVSKQIEKISDAVEVLVHTGQHYDSNMSDVFFQELGMSLPTHHLGIGGGAHGEMTGRMLVELERVIQLEKPDLVLVYGDTNSTLAGALAAAKLHVPVAHVEAGLRSFNMKMPEEVNRIVTDRVSTWLFAPTADAVAHLRREGIAEQSIYGVGDVMYDVALHHGERAMALGRGVLDQFGLQDRQYVLVTAHRAENTDVPERLSAIVDGLLAASESIEVVWPVHPRTRGSLERQGLLQRLQQNIKLMPPQGYLDMVRLEKCSAVVATDSGGVQKEAFFHKVPCVTLRDETEWVELVDAGWNMLCPPVGPTQVADSVLGAIGRVGNQIQPYGDGHAAEAIAKILWDMKS